MTMTDPIADLLTQIRNALLAKHDRLDVPASKLKMEVCSVLKQEGFIENFRLVEAKPQSAIRIYLRYSSEGVPAIQHVRRISKPGRRVYRGVDDLPQVRNGLGVGILSTSQGLLTDTEARERRVGGELLCELW
jgi:small subunit ribosomal protein S8